MLTPCISAVMLPEISLNVCSPAKVRASLLEDPVIGLILWYKEANISPQTSQADSSHTKDLPSCQISLL